MCGNECERDHYSGRCACILVLLLRLDGHSIYNELKTIMMEMWQPATTAKQRRVAMHAGF